MIMKCPEYICNSPVTRVARDVSILPAKFGAYVIGRQKAKVNAIIANRSIMQQNCNANTLKT